MLDNSPRGTICIEDIEIGMSRHLMKVITDRDIELFAEVSTDRNPVHLDDAYAQDTIFEGRIAHGMLTAGLISAVIGEQLPGHGTVYLGQSLKFMAPVRPGDMVTGFYDSNAPVPLIYPPQYQAVVMARAEPGRNVKVDFFDEDLVSSDGMLKLNLAPTTRILLENGQAFTGNPAKRYLIAVYGPATRSIPASERARLRRVRSHRIVVVPSAPLRHLRAYRVLRLVAESACDRALPGDGPFDHPVVRAR